MKTHKVTRLEDLSLAEQELVAAALKASRRAYAPYSSFAVGAAAQSRKGEAYLGANMENASYGVTVCAEVGALARAVADGDFEIVRLAVVGGAIGSEQKEDSPVVTPCGRCRQLIYEASLISGEDFEIICCNNDASQVIRARASELLPFGFGPKTMKT